MALISSYPDPTAAPTAPFMPAAYFRWSGLHIEPDDKSIRVITRIWRDKATFDAGVGPVTLMPRGLVGPEFDAWIAAHPEAAAMIDGLVNDFLRSQPGLGNATVV